MTENLASRISGRVIIGGLLIFFGLIFTLDNAGVLDAGDIFDYWPMILVVLGLLKVLQPREDGQRPFGIALLGLGVFLQLQMVFFTSWRLSLFPTLLIGGGALLVWRSSVGAATRHRLTFRMECRTSLSWAASTASSRAGTFAAARLRR